MNFRKPRSDKQYNSESERKAAWYQRNKERIDPKTKKFTISQELVMKRAGKEKILEEMAKCIVLCANCHFIEHFKGKRYGSTISQSA